MWVPVYRKGVQQAARTNLVYSIDLVRGLDVYAVDVPGNEPGEYVVAASTAGTPSTPTPVLPVALLAAGVLVELAVARVGNGAELSISIRYLPHGATGERRLEDVVVPTDTG